MTPRTTEQNEAIHEESRRKIIEAALKLFAERGYDNSSVRLIATEASISQGLLYNYFAGKQGLLIEIMKRGMDNACKAFDHIPADEPPLVQLAGLIQGIFIELEADAEFWRVFYSLRSLPAFDEILGAAIVQANMDLWQVFQGYYAQAGAEDAEIRAYLLYAMVEGLIQQYLLLGETYQLNLLVDATVKLHCQIKN